MFESINRKGHVQGYVTLTYTRSRVNATVLVYVYSIFVTTETAVKQKKALLEPEIDGLEL